MCEKFNLRLPQIFYLAEVTDFVLFWFQLVSRGIAGLELVAIFLPLPSECQDFRCVFLHLVLRFRQDPR